ncbi:MAG TPA: DUF4266 domain-containing protein [Casimicrobiaceae bacterium]|nr:DUF4266 domain-containing protein [Casimicrobiaceae bacterium]
MTWAAKRIGLVGVAAALLASGGCATVQPWERGTLAKPVMATEDPAHETAQKLRTYSAKEGGAAATGVGGGGCGCN